MYISASIWHFDYWFADAAPQDGTNTPVAFYPVPVSAEVLVHILSFIVFVRVLIDKMSVLYATSTCLSQWNPSTRSQVELVVINDLQEVFCITD